MWYKPWRRRSRGKSSWVAASQVGAHSRRRYVAATLQADKEPLRRSTRPALLPIREPSESWPDRTVPGVYCATSFRPMELALTIGGCLDFQVGERSHYYGTANVVKPSCSIWWRVVSTATFGGECVAGIFLQTRALPWRRARLAESACANGCGGAGQQHHRHFSCWRACWPAGMFALHRKAAWRVLRRTYVDDGAR